jgi:hypothetical protein
MFDQELTVDQVKALLGPPPLMPGESEQKYWAWWTAFVDPDKPKTFPVWLEVHDLAHKEWEQKRLNRYYAELVIPRQVLALASLLSAADQTLVFSARLEAEKYFSKDREETARGSRNG